VAEKNDRFVCKSFLITKSEKVTKIGARLRKLSQKQFTCSIYGMSVISNVSIIQLNYDIVFCTEDRHDNMRMFIARRRTCPANICHAQLPNPPSCCSNSGDRSHRRRTDRSTVFATWRQRVSINVSVQPCVIGGSLSRRESVFRQIACCSHRTEHRDYYQMLSPLIGSAVFARLAVVADARTHGPLDV